MATKRQNGRIVHLNPNGLTYVEWCAAAGIYSSAALEAGVRVTINASRAAWNRGEDPTETRKAVEDKIHAHMDAQVQLTNEIVTELIAEELDGTRDVPSE